MTGYNTYDIGDLVRVSAVFKNASGEAADPTTVRVQYKNSAAGVLVSMLYGTDSEVIKCATGEYYLDIEVDQAGMWHYKWVGGGVVTAVEEGFFRVRETNVR